MSETTEPDGKPAPEPEPTPTPGTGPAGAPESTPEHEEPEQKPQREADEEGRRVAQLRARLGAAEREQAAQRAELEFYRRQIAAQAPQQDTPEQAEQRLRMQIRDEERTKIQTETFHQAGEQQIPDWRRKCDDLVAMGADAGFARLLVDMPGGEGVKVVAALANDPDAVQRITNIQTPHGRAIALGKYAASIDDAPTHRGNGNAPQMTRAPAPIRPVTGRANPTFNEYTAPPEQLVDVYLKRDLERARGGSRR